MDLQAAQNNIAEAYLTNNIATSLFNCPPTSNPTPL